MFVHTTVSIFTLQHFNDPNLNCFTFWGSADHCGGGLGGSTTQPKVTADQPSKPWKFHSNPFTWVKVIHDFQCHRCTNSIQNQSPLHPIKVRAEFFFYPVFSTSRTNKNQSKSALFIWLARISITVLWL